MLKKRSFFERLTGGIRLEDETETTDTKNTKTDPVEKNKKPEKTMTIHPTGESANMVIDDEPEEGQLTVDVYETPSEIIVQAFVAGVKPEDLTITITRNNVLIRGKREENKTIMHDDYISRELYWGSFSRTIELPVEVEPESADAIEKHGLLSIKVPKIDKSKKASLKVKSL